MSAAVILLPRLNDATVLPDEALTTVVILAELLVGPRCGQKTTARSFDAMISAIALSNGLPLYACNPDDSAGIDGRVVVPVPVPA